MAIENTHRKKETTATKTVEAVRVRKLAWYAYGQHEGGGYRGPARAAKRGRAGGTVYLPIHAPSYCVLTHILAGDPRGALSPLALLSLSALTLSSSSSSSSSSPSLLSQSLPLLELVEINLRGRTPSRPAICVLHLVSSRLVSSRLGLPQVDVRIHRPSTVDQRTSPCPRPPFASLSAAVLSLLSLLSLLLSAACPRPQLLLWSATLECCSLSVCSVRLAVHCTCCSTAGCWAALPLRASLPLPLPTSPQQHLPLLLQINPLVLILL